MAGPSRVGERVYQELRARLFAGEFRLRDRLDVASLSTTLRVSNTPVREALVRLAAERLIASKPSRGFFVSLWSESELKTLYDWRCLLTRAAIEQGSVASAIVNSPASEAYPVRLARLFQAVEAKANHELRRA